MMGDAVGNAGELVVLKQIIIVEQIVLQDLAVQAGYAVDGLGEGHAQVGHVHLTVGDDGHVADALPLVGIEVEELVAQAAVELLQNHVNAGQGGAEHINRPLFQRLGQNGVVGIHRP